MFQSLYSRLALGLLSVFLVMAVLLFWLFEQASVATQNEASQRLHIDLAKNVVKDLGITNHGKFDSKMIKEAFHQMMILGPTIELYVLDEKGSLVTYDAPEEKIKRRSVDLYPITSFIERSSDLPILGDDPRSTSKQKIFSAARVYAKNNESKDENKDGMGVFVGYLYIIIGGENFDSISTALELNKAWKISLLGIISALLFLLFASLLLFYALTRPLRRLTKEIKAFESVEKTSAGFIVDEGESDDGKGELNQLKRTFHQMEERIVAQLARLNKQDEIRSEFLAYVSHDLRTPLAGMKAYLETLELKQDSMSSEERHTYLKKAINNGDRLEGMINELFELTRLESGQIEVKEDEFIIGDLLSDIYTSLEEKAKKNKVNLIVDCKEPEAQISADMAKIERVIQNLVENAIRYSKQGGDIVLRTERIDQNTHNIKIIDYGSGIAAHHLNYIFEPYYRVADDKQLKHMGAGLGLAISQRLLLLHNSTLKVESKLGKGTTFSFYLSH